MTGRRERTPAEISWILRPYVPRLIINWLRNTPDELHQAIDCSMVFVDISGFTALTERLARKGKIGAELMRDTLDGVFTALLDEAYEWGAGLLKWGGDALLLMFDGPGHEARACRAAWEMQKTIDRVGRLHVTGGTIILRMSVGIGTGTYHFFMTGSVHRELLIAGPVMSETLHMENIADATEIGLTPELAEVLRAIDPALIGPPKDVATLLAGPPEAVRARAGDVGDVSSIDIASCIPVAARAHVLLEKSEPEHRTITAAFIDMMDTDQLLEEIGPQDLAVALDFRIRSIEEAALRFEVPFYETDIGKSSVKALLTAGAPSSTGRDEERVLRALREIMDEPGVVPMRVGVNTGKVFTGDFGPPYRRSYRVFGDAINTAARVMSKASAGQILSTEIVLARSHTIFEATPITPFAAKGKSEPVKASLVGPILGTKEIHRQTAPLVGRGTELAAILEVLERVREGSGAIVELTGEAGVGKTRIVDEVIARSPDVRVLRARCEEYERSTPYFPMRAVMRAALGVGSELTPDEVGEVLVVDVEQRDPELVPWLPLLGLLLGLDLPHTPETRALDARFLRERLAEVAAEFLDRTLSGAPLMMVIEDAHYVDEASRDLVLRLAAAGRERRQLLLATHQSDEAVFAGDEDLRFLLLAIAPLTQEEAEELVNRLTEDKPLRPHDVAEIARRSAGNGLFLVELLETVRAAGSVGALPDSVESLIAGEIDRLAPTDRTILRYAAVVGASVDPELLRDSVSQDVELDDGVWGRLSALLVPETSGQLRFRNTLVRDAAYEGLPYRRRRALHERVAHVIERRAGATPDEEIGVLAFHYYEAQRWDKAWVYCRQAGDRAASIYARLDASRYYERALAAGRRLRAVDAAHLAEVYGLWSDALYLLGQYDDADRALIRARSLLKAKPVEAAPLVVKQAKITSRLGRYRQTNLRITRALHALDGIPGRDAAASRARLMVINAGTRYFQNQRSESIRWSRLTEVEAKRSGAKDALAQAYKLLDLAYKEGGEVEKAVYSARALELYEELGELRDQALILNNMGIIAQERSKWDEALHLYDRALEIFDRTGDRTNACLAKYNIAEILTDQGRLDEAEPLQREVLRVWRASGADADVAEARRELGRLLARRGDFAAAREQLDSARAEQVRAGKEGEELVTAYWICELHVLAGETGAALAAIRDTVALAHRVEGGSVFLPMLQRLHGWASVQGGQAAEGDVELSAALEGARRRGEALETTLLLDALIAIRGRRGEPIAALEAERDVLVEQLGIVRLPAVPLEPASAELV
jgi:class 3 adenylate cyclase/tetratricopeptide (TPR) repeat protein